MNKEREEQLKRNAIKAGTWTKEKLLSACWTSASECLAHEEQNYQEELARLSQRMPLMSGEKAAEERLWIEVHITSARESLGALIKEE